jgi:hypothetical protein
LTLNAAVAATKTAVGATSVPITVNIATAGQTGGTFGAFELTVTFGAVVAAKKDAHAATAVPLTATIVVAAKKDAHAATAVPVTFGVVSSAATGRYGAAAVPIVLTIGTRGGTPSPVPNLDAVLTGWIAAPVIGYQTSGTTGRIRTPQTGSIA